MDVDEVAHVLGIVFCRAPLGEFDLAPGTMNVEENEEIDRAVATILVIAMRYFDLPPDSAEYASVEKFAAEAIMDEWKLGVRHKIVLANKAIAVIEDRHPIAISPRCDARFTATIDRWLPWRAAVRPVSS